MTAKDHVSFRLGPQTNRWIDEQARSHGITRTHVVRAVFSAAFFDEVSKGRIQERMRNFAKASKAMDLPLDVQVPDDELAGDDPWGEGNGVQA